MLIGVPKEIKSDEYRIGLTPESVQSLTQSGHEVLIEQNAGLGIGKDNEASLSLPIPSPAFCSISTS